MSAAPEIRGIEGLSGREPIGAALAVGVKSKSGAPEQKDRFHILCAQANAGTFSRRDGSSYTSPFREPHPAFAAFNAAGPELRRAILARLAHATVAECFEYRLNAQTLPNHPPHPKRAPACRGDGLIAVRWDGAEYRRIACPHDRCEFRQAPKGKKPPCGPWMRFLARFDFQPRPDGRKLPSIPFKFTSGSWNTTKNFVGFFDAFERACRAGGVDPLRVPLFGLPVLLTLAEQTDGSQQARFPVVSVQVAGDGDIIGWIAHQLSRVRELSGARQVAALTDQAEQDPDALLADHLLINGPVEARVPGNS
jgi:hypothetical protein